MIRGIRSPVTAEEQNKLQELDREIARARKLRRGGGLFLGFCALYLCIPMLIGAFSGAWGGEIKDPYTGEPYVDPAETSVYCKREARRLFGEAYSMPKMERRWEEQARAWRAKCRKPHPDLAELMAETRRDLRDRSDNPK